MAEQLLSWIQWMVAQYPQIQGLRLDAMGTDVCERGGGAGQPSGPCRPSLLCMPGLLRLPALARTRGHPARRLVLLAWAARASSLRGGAGPHPRPPRPALQAT